MRHRLLPLLFRDAIDLQTVCYVTSDREPGKRSVLLKYHAAVLSGTVDRLFIHQDLTGIGLIQASDQTQQSGLATSRGTEQNPEFANIAPFPGICILNVEVDVVEGVDFRTVRADKRPADFADGDFRFLRLHIFTLGAWPPSGVP